MKFVLSDLEETHQDGSFELILVKDNFLYFYIYNVEE